VIVSGTDVESTVASPKDGATSFARELFNFAVALIGFVCLLLFCVCVCVCGVCVCVYVCLYRCVCLLTKKKSDILLHK